MQALLEDLFRALRGSDLEVSLNAQIDAVRAASLVGWEDRLVLKAALGTTLAKSSVDRERFDLVFDRFFAVGPAAMKASVPDQPVADLALEASLSRLLLSGDDMAIARRVQQASREAGLFEIRHATQKGQFAERIQRAMGMDDLEREIVQAGGAASGSALARELDAARKRLAAQVRLHVERHLTLYTAAAARGLREEFLVTGKLADIDPRDFNRMNGIVSRLSKRLAARHARRRKRRLRGTLDLRRTLRRNIAYGGVMFEMVWKTEVVERPRVVAICDVSGSVRRYARFLLLFLYSLGEQLSHLRSFAFTNRLIEVSDVFRQHTVQDATEEIMRTVGGSGTDYGQMLLDARDLVLDHVDSRTTVLILGDARNNGAAAQSAVMKSLHDRAARVIWLNPEPPSHWGTGDSVMHRYLPYCHVARECNSIAHLERTLDHLLRHG